MKKLVLGLLALTPAFAFAAPGPYVGVQAGVNWVDPSANFQNGSDTTTKKSQNDSHGFAGGANAGFLWGDNTINYGLEADALVYPNSNSSIQSISGAGKTASRYDGYNLSLLAVLKYTCASGFTAFVKAGGAYVVQQFTLQGDDTATQRTFSEATTFAPEAAIGVGYMLNHNLEVDFTADEVFAGDQKNIDVSPSGVATASTNTTENRNFLLGLTYHFC